MDLGDLHLAFPLWRIDPCVIALVLARRRPEVGGGQAAAARRSIPLAAAAKNEVLRDGPASAPTIEIVMPGNARPSKEALGIWLPAASLREPTVPDYGFRTYLTYSEFAGTDPLPEDEIVARIERLSASDCLLAIAQLSTRLFQGGGLELQDQLIEAVAGQGSLSRRLRAMLRLGRWDAVVCEQQLVHLARLVVLHADRRAPDEFRGGALLGDWVMCLLAVTDWLDSDLDYGDPVSRLSWEIRQSELNHQMEQLPLMAMHYELYAVLWPRLNAEQAERVDAAFRSVSGMSIREYFTVGSAIAARLVNYGAGGGGAPLIDPEVYFRSTRLSPDVHRAFFSFIARGLDELAAELRAEEERFGPTTYGSLTFERFPLAECQPGVFVPLSMASLLRRVTEGVFHVLAEAAEREGRDRRHYTSTFGDVFQILVEQALNRGNNALEHPVPLSVDFEYGGRSNRHRSPDVMLAHERNPVFVEAVSGPLQAATITRGDADTFAADLQRLVIGKAKQLDRCIRAFLDGRLEVEGADRSNLHKIWPIIVTSHSFPHQSTISQAVRDSLASNGYLDHAKVGDLAIVSAEDLFFCEGHMQRGQTLLKLTRRWKSGDLGDFPFKNTLIALGGGRAPGSTYFERRFAEANAEWIDKLIGIEISADEVLERTRDPEDGGDLPSP